MATWRERFEELLAEHGRQADLNDAGNDNHSEVKASKDALAEFTRQYEAAGMPNKDTEMTPP